MFSDLNIKRCYRSKHDDLNRDFMIPVISRSTIYDRGMSNMKNMTFLAKLRKDMEKLEANTRKEIQPKKKFELYQQVQTLKKQLEEIENG